MSLLFTPTIYVLLLAVLIHICGSLKCPRDKSRLARSIIKQNFIARFKSYGYSVPSQCALNPKRDVYLDNEQHRETDNADKWSCNYCGKTFAYEHFLDQHFDNRHTDRVYQGKDRVCLDDHCDYLRCEVMSGAKKPSYWEQALCKQADLDKLQKKCEVTMKSCLPDLLSGMERHEFLDDLKKHMCNSLTCDEYWEHPINQGSPHTAAVYIVLSCVLAIGLLLYYLMAYTHFYADPTSLSAETDGLLQRNLAEDDRYNYRAPEGTEMRNRYGYPAAGT